MKLRPILLLAAAVKSSLAQNESIRRSGQISDETTEHEDDPTELTEFSEHPAPSERVRGPASPQIDASALLQQILVEIPQHQDKEQKLKLFKRKKNLEKAKQAQAAKKGVPAKREVTDEHDPDELQFEIDDFVASVRNFQSREERKKKRQELKMLQ